MIKSELILQILIFGMTAAAISLLVAKLYPNHTYTPNKVGAVSPVKEIVQQQISPSLIHLSSIDLTLPIAEGAITDNQWTLYEDKASWLKTSKTPGQGNVILYAHNKDNLFGNLKRVELGDTIKVVHLDKEYRYKVVDKQQVVPSDVEAILSIHNQLTLYTCDGSFDQRRLVVIAYPEQAI